MKTIAAILLGIALAGYAVAGAFSAENNNKTIGNALTEASQKGQNAEAIHSVSVGMLKTYAAGETAYIGYLTANELTKEN